VQEFITYPELQAYGIPYTRVHLNRLMAASKFPMAVKLGANRIAWTRHSIEHYLATRPAARPLHSAAA
jgi:predicted DNA-binding transcriptional regulator AlpA